MSVFEVAENVIFKEAIMLTTTLNKIHEHSPCVKGWKKLMKSLGKTKADDEVLPLEYILESNGLDDAMWALRAVNGHQKAMRLYACYCAKRALPDYEKADNRVRACIETAESFAYGQSTREEMDAAWDAVRDITRDAVWNAAWIVAMDAAWDTAWDAAWAVTRNAAWEDFQCEFIRLLRLEGKYGDMGMSEFLYKGYMADFCAYALA